MRLGDPATLTQIDELDGLAFERFLEDLFARLGYQAELTEHYDLGADLVVVRKGERVAVQAKRVSKWVGISAVREVVGAKPIYACSGAMVVTNKWLSGPARRLAEAHDVELWDRRKLEQEILRFCNVCEKRVTPRVREWCLENSDRFGGRVYCIDHQRDLSGLLRSA